MDVATPGVGKPSWDEHMEELGQSEQMMAHALFYVHLLL